MKRYFTMSLTLFLFSILNALTFLLLGILTGNTAYSEIYSITYPIQFVVAIFQSFFASASNIRANKEGKKLCRHRNHTWTYFFDNNLHTSCGLC